MPWFEKHWDMSDHQVQKLFATPDKKFKKRHLMKKPTIPTIPPTWGSQKPPKPFEVFLCTNWQSSRVEEDQHPSKFS
jgi:hypothetical protein